MLSSSNVCHLLSVQLLHEGKVSFSSTPTSCERPCESSRFSCPPCSFCSSSTFTSGTAVAASVLRASAFPSRTSLSALMIQQPVSLKCFASTDQSPIFENQLLERRKLVLLCCPLFSSSHGGQEVPLHQSEDTSRASRAVWLPPQDKRPLTVGGIRVQDRCGLLGSGATALLCFSSP